MASVERRGSQNYATEKKRESKKRKQDERQETGKERERHGGAWVNVRNTKSSD